MPYFNPHNFSSIATRDFFMVSAIPFPVQLRGNASTFLGTPESNQFPAGLSVSSGAFLGAIAPNQFPVNLRNIAV